MYLQAGLAYYRNIGTASLTLPYFTSSKSFLKSFCMTIGATNFWGATPPNRIAPLYHLTMHRARAYVVYSGLRVEPPSGHSLSAPQGQTRASASVHFTRRRTGMDTALRQCQARLAQPRCNLRVQMYSLFCFTPQIAQKADFHTGFQEPLLETSLLSLHSVLPLPPLHGPLPPGSLPPPPGTLTLGAFRRSAFRLRIRCRHVVIH